MGQTAKLSYRQAFRRPYAYPTPPTVRDSAIAPGWSAGWGMIDEYVAGLRKRVESLIDWVYSLETAKEFLSRQWKAEFPYSSIRLQIERKSRGSHLSYLRFRFYPMSRKQAEKRRRPKFSKFLGPTLTRKRARKAKSEHFWVKQRSVIQVFNDLCIRIRKAHRVVWDRLKRVDRAGKFTTKGYLDAFYGLRQFEELFAVKMRAARRIVPPASASSVQEGQP